MTQKSYEELVADAKTRIREVSAQDAMELRERGDGVVFLDVREPQEWNLFRIPNAVHVPLGQLSERIVEQVAPERTVVIYCASGNRSALAADAMQRWGYGDVASLAGGIKGWAYAGGELDEE
ncbi:MAG TPA: rhodanese-like domain-containing protein [Gemmatimonadaceae bacterium]|nr:rhodanese-like domain-containing protein [Gemmatimonadaceae bacterium]